MILILHMVWERGGLSEAQAHERGIHHDVAHIHIGE